MQTDLRCQALRPVKGVLGRTLTDPPPASRDTVDLIHFDPVQWNFNSAGYERLPREGLQKKA
jgi:hypothetical protein